MESFNVGTIEAITHPGTKPERLLRVARGLADGSLYQTGGVVREAIPPGHRGRIFAHVYQNGLAERADAIRWPAEMSQSLSQVQTLATAATALSAINLGVSVAGFIYLSRKIDRVERSVRSLESAISAKFAGLEGKLDRIDEKLSGISYAIEAGAQLVTDDVGRLRRQLDWTVLAQLRSSAESLAEIEAGRRGGYDPGVHAEKIRSVRVYLAGAIEEGLGHLDVELVTPDTLRLRSLVLALAQSIAAEAQAWRLEEETRTSADMLLAQLPTFQTYARRSSLPFVSGDPALLGSLSAGDEQSRALLVRVPALLLVDAPAWTSQNALTSRLAADWSSYLHDDPARARRFAREPEAQRRRIAAGANATYPMAEAATSLDGLAAEYRLLADRNVPREAWEMTQQASEHTGIFVRECPAEWTRAA